ncbi:MAG TPA: 6-phosphogluconolactonase [bacterium]|nr:6-phosphogluconolactonase [bacterium]
MTSRVVFDDLESLSRAAADAIAARLREAVAARGRCSFVLTGGRTPRRMYELLGERHRDDVPWHRVDLFWGDERYVPPDHPHSNYGLARTSLLERVAPPPGNVHPIPTYHGDPAAGALAYEALLQDYFRGREPVFDLLLLGMAANGHVASLFPRHPALHERARWIVAVEVPADPPQRITVTFPLINRARAVIFFVAGPAKAEAVARALAPGTTVDEIPAVGVRPVAGEVRWWLDRQAAALLPRVTVNGRAAGNASTSDRG